MKSFIIVLIITIILAFTLSFLHTQWVDNSAVVSARGALFSGITSINSLIVNSGRYIGGTFTYIGRLINAEKKNSELLARLEKQNIRLSQHKLVRQENILLRQELRYKQKDLYNLTTITSEIIARGSDTWFDSIIIDKGWKDGVEIDYAVVNSEGLVGRVVEAGAHYSKVMLLINQNSNVSVVASNTQDKGIVQGKGLNDLSLKYIPHSSVLKIGMPIYTSGVSLVFPKGILVGHVSKIIKKKYDHLQYVDIKPSVHFSRLDRVWVIVVRNRGKIPTFLDEKKHITANNQVTANNNEPIKKH
ncbi:rod shape-determining protein MreC [Candidatus Margulisiibacteriota bacterium]